MAPSVGFGNIPSNKKNMKIIDYIIVKEKTSVQNYTDSLEEQVKKLIVEGWQPFGQIFVNKGQLKRQVMVKYEEPVFVEGTLAVSRYEGEEFENAVVQAVKNAIANGTGRLDRIIRHVSQYPKLK